MESSTTTHVVPSAGSRGIGTLVSSELVDKDTSVTILVDGAAAASGGAAGGIVRTIGLGGVLESSRLKIYYEHHRTTAKALSVLTLSSQVQAPPA